MSATNVSASKADATALAAKERPVTKKNVKRLRSDSEVGGVACIDGRDYSFYAGETILELVSRVIEDEKAQAKSIPTLCYDARLKPYGSCRVCTVEIAQAADGPRRVVAACHTPAVDKQHIFTKSPRVDRLRKNIVELVLSDYPTEVNLAAKSNGLAATNEHAKSNDSSANGALTTNGVSTNGAAANAAASNGAALPLFEPRSEKSPHGYDELQNVVDQVGLTEVRYRLGENHLDAPKDTSHPYMVSDLSKCIMCYRCVRACDEIQGEFVLAAAGRGMESRIIKGMDQSFQDSDCVACGACSQTCPTGAISDIFRAEETEADKTVRTVCSYCGVGCNLDVAVKDNTIVSIVAPETAAVNYGHTCLKGRYAFGFYNHPDRLTSPLFKRSGKFEECSWDEAYDFIEKKLKTLIADHGPDSIAGISSARCTNEENYLMQKLIRAVVGTNNIDCCARVCHAPTAFGMQKAFGTGAATNSIDDIALADCFLLIGANPRFGHPVTGAKLKQAVMKGKTFIVIDPVETEMAKMADYHLQLRPGTNVALLNMMAYYIITEGKVDQDFVDSRCEGWYEFEAEIRNIDLDAMEAKCGVDRNLVKAAAIAYAESPRAMEFHGLGVTEHTQGSRTVMLIANLAMMTGNIGRPGVGMNPLRGQNNVQGAADMGVQPHQGAGYMDVTDPTMQQKYTEHYGRPAPPEIGFKIPQMFDAAKAGNLKALWIMGEDVAQTDPNAEHVVECLEALELLVVQDIFLSETAKLADVVLPATSFLEKDGTFTNSERRVQRVNQAVDPLPGTKSDGQIVIDMMNRLGYDQPDYTPDGVLAEIADIVPFFAGAKWDELGDDGKQWPILPDGSDTQILHQQEFKRGKGKFHFFEFEESQEVEENLNDKFPLILTTGRNLVHYNCGTMTRRTPNGEICTEDLLMINPKDAKKRSIDDSEFVNLVSDRGEVRLRAQVTDDVKPGTLHTTFHFPEFMVNRVTSDVVDRESLCPEFKVTAVDVQKI